MNRHQNLQRYVFAGLILLILLAGCQTTTPVQTESVKPSAVSVERGKYLTEIGGCQDCHTPFKMGERGPEPDMSRMLSGHPADVAMPEPVTLDQPWSWMGSATNTAFAGPWGISYATNLTPDAETGIGKWKEQMFVQAIQKGKHMGQGRMILPPMPWPAYRNMTEEDLRSIFAYLQSIPAIANRVPDARVAPPPGN